ncbi:enoyl-CoA hydratase/isomerase family protein [Streptomyces sp. NPDC050549]|uniref:enoyl-CoA hydratase/isomerase family protein n=1 Tax=Streptomyces sp. NPDC050549 TaxID=3155406 RepID=UPI00342188CF
MTQPSTISVEQLTPGIRKITFSNPPVNLILKETVSRLVEVVTELSEDPQVHVAVLTSSTPGYFFNQFDLDRVADFMPSDPEATPTWIDLVIRLSTAPFVSIASIRGRTRGGGGELALACDLRYASRERAVFGRSEGGGGILPGCRGSEHLPRLIGRDRALEAILSSNNYDADTAERYGWVTRSVADAELDDFVDGAATRLASFGKAALAAAKARANRATPPPDADPRTAYTQFLSSPTRPGIEAFLPRFEKPAAEKGPEELELRSGGHLGIARPKSR